MHKKIFLIMISTLMIFSLCSCKKDKIIVSDEYTFEESFEKLENGIADKYGLQDFELAMITVISQSGYGASHEISCYGYYQKDNTGKLWHETYEISDNDKVTLIRLNKSPVIYNKNEYLQYTENTGVNASFTPIITDVPGWVIEGIYNIIFD